MIFWHAGFKQKGPDGGEDTPKGRFSNTIHIGSSRNDGSLLGTTFADEVNVVLARKLATIVTMERADIHASYVGVISAVTSVYIDVLTLIADRISGHVESLLINEERKVLLTILERWWMNRATQVHENAIPVLINPFSLLHGILLVRLSLHPGEGADVAIVNEALNIAFYTNRVLFDLREIVHVGMAKATMPHESVDRQVGRRSPINADDVILVKKDGWLCIGIRGVRLHMVLLARIAVRRTVMKVKAVLNLR